MGSVRKPRSFLSAATVVGVCAFLFSNPANFYARGNGSPGEALSETYFVFLDSVLSDPDAKPVEALQEFLREKPAFEPAYAKLLELYLFQGQVTEARRYFESLIHHSRYRRNSFWMLARLFAFRDSTEAAYRAFERALKEGSPSVELLRDFVEFDHQHSAIPRGKTLLRRLPLTEDQKRIVQAVYDYHNLDYVKTTHRFRELSRVEKTNPLILHIWGTCYLRLSQYPRADSVWRKGLSMARAQGDLRFQGHFLLDLGVLAKNRGHYDLALSYYDSAYAIANRILDLRLKQLVLGNRGNIGYIQGDYQQAEAYYREAIALASTIGAFNYATVWHSSRGLVLLHLGRFNEALQAYNQSELLARKLNDVGHLIWLKYSKADLYSYLNQRELAKEMYRKAYELARGRNLIEYQERARVKMADLLFEEGDYRRARQAFREYIEFLKSRNAALEQAYWTGKIAATYKAEGKYELARRHYLQAINIARRAGSKSYEAWYLVELGNVEFAEGLITDAISKFNSGREIAAAQNNDNLLSEVYLGLGNSYRELGDLDRAVAYYSQAAQIIERSRRNLTVDELRIGYFSHRFEVYRKLVACLWQRYKKHPKPATLDSLYAFMELGRGRALRDLIAEQESNVSADAGRKPSPEYELAKRRLRIIQRQIRQQMLEFGSEQDLHDLYARLGVARYSILAQRLKALAQNPADEVARSQLVAPFPVILERLKKYRLGLLFYHISDEASFVLAATGERVEVVPLRVRPKSVTVLVDSLIAPLHNVSEEDVGRTPFRATIAHRLYGALVKPVEQAVALPERLLIVPDIAIMSLPFDLLLVEAPPGSQYTPEDQPTYAAHFLVNRYSIVYSPSSSLLLDEPGSVAKNAGLLVFANPFESPSTNPAGSQLTLRTGWRFDPLVFSAEEANKIKTLYSRTHIYQRDRATKSTFLREASAHQILHFATHAFVDSAFDAFSGLVLAAGDDSTDDGILMGYEISELRLNCELVTLSGCETGRGKLVGGEGVLGLPRRFLAAGAKSVLMTHWKVDDRFAAKLIPRFYSHYLKKGLSKIEALSTAKREILKKTQDGRRTHYQHPFYWASFTLIGDPGIPPGRPWSTPAKTVLVLGAMLALGGYILVRTKVGFGKRSIEKFKR